MKITLTTDEIIEMAQAYVDTLFMSNSKQEVMQVDLEETDDEVIVHTNTR